MLRYHSVDHAKAIRLENVCEDIENNNTQDKNQNFDDKHDVIHYSSNSKGIFAQVRVRIISLMKYLCIFFFSFSYLFNLN